MRRLESFERIAYLCMRITLLTHFSVSGGAVILPFSLLRRSSRTWSLGLYATLLSEKLLSVHEILQQLHVRPLEGLVAANLKSAFVGRRRQNT
jgi:hypothetical protein